MHSRFCWLITLGLVGWFGGPLAAQEHPPRPRLIPWEHTAERAGYPSCIAWYARPSETAAYTGYYVGGGSAIGGRHRTAIEGTWGWDYKTYLLPRRVLLFWSSRYQGGTEAYQTEGGPHVPDLPTLLNPALHSHKKAEQEE
jgi:hypothetical protein